MTDLEALATRARRASELGRLRAALRIGWLPVLLGACSLSSGGELASCVAVTSLLLLTVVALRWWRRSAALAARHGLAMGLVPLAAGLLACAAGARAGCAPGSIEASWLCVIAGAVAGAGVTLLAARRQGALAPWLAATTVASLTGALGCLALGLGGLLAMLAALGATALLTWLPLRLRTI